MTQIKNYQFFIDSMDQWIKYQSKLLIINVISIKIFTFVEKTVNFYLFNQWSIDREYQSCWKTNNSNKRLSIFHIVNESM